MDTPNPKRLCHTHSVTSSKENPCSLSNSPGFNQSNIDMTISSFLSLSHLPMFSSPLPVGCSFDQVLVEVIHSAAETSHDEFEKDLFMDRALQLASLLYSSTKRCIRERATLQNFISWPLLPELTTKIFSMLDTKSLIQASACCTMFNKCTMDRECYSHIDLTTAAEHVDNEVVSRMIRRAGKELRSIKLGSTSLPAGSTSLLTRSCLTPLTYNHGFSGGLLRSLHLYDVMISGKFLHPVVSACSNLTDFKIVGLYRGVGHTNHDQLELLGLLTRKCRLIKHLFIEIKGVGIVRLPPTSLECVDESPNLVSLSLLGFRLDHAEAQKLIKSFPQLKYLNLSGSLVVNSGFLRDLGLSCKNTPLETLILRDICDLFKGEVVLFLHSLLAGDFKSIRLIDISHIYGFVRDGNGDELRFAIEELKKQRPEVTLVANFGSPASSRNSSYSMEEEDEYYEDFILDDDVEEVYDDEEEDEYCDFILDDDVEEVNDDEEDEYCDFILDDDVEEVNDDEEEDDDVEEVNNDVD